MTACTPRVVAIVQARMGSSRLPGKVLLPLGGRVVLRHVIDRIRASEAADEIVVATTTADLDDELARVAATLGTTVFRGSESDVLSRYAGASAASGADIVIRVTGDCPLIDPGLLAEMAVRFKTIRDGSQPADILTNARVRSFPRGLDVEILTRAALQRANAEATAPPHREHVTPFLYENPTRFHIVDQVSATDYSRYRLTLDTDDDYVLLTKIFEAQEITDPSDLGLDRVLDLLSKNPGWAALNAHVRQRELTEQPNGERV